MLRRALLVWGLGHVTLGDRRGWLLVAAQPLAILGLFVAAAQLIDGTRWLVIFPPLVLLIVIWLAQAIHAYQRAIDLGATRGGELQVALFLPLAVAALTAYWLFGGRFGSPGATVQAYVEAWVAGRPDVGTTLYVSAPSASQLALEWAAQNARLDQLVDEAAARYGPASGLEPERPFRSLRVREVVDGRLSDTGSRSATFAIDIVRSLRIETTVLGIIPTAGQLTVVVVTAWTLELELVPRQPSLGLVLPGLESDIWRIRAVQPIEATVP